MVYVMHYKRKSALTQGHNSRIVQHLLNTLSGQKETVKKTHHEEGERYRKPSPGGEAFDR